MLQPESLSHDKLSGVVREIVDALYWCEDDDAIYYDPEADWSPSTLAAIAAALEVVDLAPTERTLIVKRDEP